MAQLPRNEVSCVERQCRVNCYHCYGETCVVPLNGQIITVNSGGVCKHTDETYESGMVLLENKSNRERANPEDLIRQKYGIPHDCEVTDIHRRNFQADGMAYINALFNSPPRPTHF